MSIPSYFSNGIRLLARAIQAKPTIFQPGDIVEVGFSVVGCPIKTVGQGLRFKMRLILRYILLQDSSLSTVGFNS